MTACNSTEGTYLLDGVVLGIFELLGLLGALLLLFLLLDLELLEALKGILFVGFDVNGEGESVGHRATVLSCRTHFRSTVS